MLCGAKVPYLWLPLFYIRKAVIANKFSSGCFRIRFTSILEKCRRSIFHGGLDRLGYAAFGLKPVMDISVVCFFVTALFECFIKLGYQPIGREGNVLRVIKHDFIISIRFLARERRDILKLLLLAALSRFFVMGVTLVGLPFLVRTVLGLDAKYYGGAESALAVATILGSAAAGFLTGKLRSGGLSWLLAAIGLCMIPAGAAFLFPIGTLGRYAVNVAAFCGMQVAVSIFSIFAVSLIQQNTPGDLIGKVMAYTSAVTLCAQPLGQTVYGFLFDGFRERAAVCLIGLFSNGFFRKMERACEVCANQAENL